MCDTFGNAVSLKSEIKFPKASSIYTQVQISLELFKIHSKVSAHKRVYLYIFALNVPIQTFTLTTSLIQIL